MKIQKVILKYYILFLLSVVMSFVGTTAFSSHIQDKSVYGYLEPVTLYPNEIPLTAKLDTGAVTASLSAKDIHLYQRNDKDYVRFKVSHPDIKEIPKYDLPVERITKIKNRASEGKSKKHDVRPVVKIPIHFDGKHYRIMVNLIDRSHFSTPMLLGRETLEKLNAIVDGTTKNTIK